MSNGIGAGFTSYSPGSGFGNFLPPATSGPVAPPVSVKFPASSFPIGQQHVFPGQVAAAQGVLGPAGIPLLPNAPLHPGAPGPMPGGAIGLVMGAPGIPGVQFLKPFGFGAPAGFLSGPHVVAGGPAPAVVGGGSPGSVATMAPVQIGGGSILPTVLAPGRATNRTAAGGIGIRWDPDLGSDSTTQAIAQDQPTGSAPPVGEETTGLDSRCVCNLAIDVVWGKKPRIREESEKLGIPYQTLVKAASEAGQRRGLMEAKLTRRRAASPVRGGRGGSRYQGFPTYGFDSKSFEQLSEDEKTAMQVPSGPHPNDDEKQKGVQFDPQRFCIYYIVRHSCDCSVDVWQLRRDWTVVGENVVRFSPGFFDDRAVPQVWHGPYEASYDGAFFVDDDTDDIRSFMVATAPADPKSGDTCVKVWMDCPSVPEVGSNGWEWLVVAKAQKAGCVPAVSVARIAFGPGDSSPRIMR